MRRSVTRLAATVLALAAFGCGDSGADDDAPAGGEPEPVTLTVGVLPIVETATLQIARDQGYFKEESLTIKTQFAAGGAAIVPAVMSGDQQIGWGNTTSTLIAASRLPIRVIAPGAQTGTGDEDISSLVVPKDSPIREPEDLEGKTVSVNTLKNISEITTRAALEKAGVDLGTVEFIEVGFPDVPAAISTGRVDAAFVVEPFRTIVLGQGARELLKPFTDAAEGERLQTTEWVTSADYLESNREIVERFVRAIQRANAYAAENPDEARAALLRYTELPPAVAEQIRLPVWNQEIDRRSVELQVDLLERYGWISERPDLQELYPEIETE